ncbi:MAG: Uncharacterised protein [Bacteroidetes bacterium MED-G17]|nr:MAG: Uncharacterised protein [Bacteroidetes bacterium MED-G17]
MLLGLNKKLPIVAVQYRYSPVVIKILIQLSPQP